MSKPPKGWTDQWGPGDVRWTQDVPAPEAAFIAENEAGEKSTVEGDRVTLETAPYRTLDYIQTPEDLAGYVEAEIEERIREGRLALPPSPAPQEPVATIHVNQYGNMHVTTPASYRPPQGEYPLYAIPPSPAPPREGALDELKRRLDLVEEIACELVDSGTISEDDHERIMAATNGRAALPPSPAPRVHDPYRNLDVYERMAKGFEALGVLRKMWTAQEVANWIRGQTKAAPPSAPALPPSRAPEPVAWRMGSDDNGWIVYADKVAAEMEMGEGDVLIPLYAALPPSPTPSPVMLAPAGCVCPAGAEQTCNGAFCPRRAMKWTVT